MQYYLPPIQQVEGLSDSQKKEVLDHLFEHCETLHAFLIPKLFAGNKNYTTYKDFIEQARLELLWFLSSEISHAQAQDSATIDPCIAQIIAAHPRLGASPKKVISLSEHSKQEQASLQGQGNEEEAQELAYLNSLYEKTFPGLRYVVFVNGRPRSVIMKNMRERIARNDINEERKEAFNAMCDIALDRANKLGAKL